MAHLNWTDQSIKDLINIAEFIRKDSARYAKITVERIRALTKQLKAYPSSGRKVPETNLDSIRELILGNYRIIYYLLSSHIDILAIHHSAKQLNIEELKKHIK